MTIPAHAAPLQGRLPSAAERDAANSLRTILASGAGQPEGPKLFVADGDGTRRELHLTPAMSELLLELLRHIGRGDAVTLVPISQMLTTQQAADLLNVSRPHVIGLLAAEDIAFEMVGRHRRIRAADLFDYKQRRDQRRAQALATLARDDADLL
jgi:excisionase family DNA binding protein